MSINIVIMAAGKGTRMNSDLPKVLHELAGKPLLQHVLETADAFQPQRITIVVGHRYMMVKKFVERLSLNSPISFAIQEPQLGTGHAVKCALPCLHKNDGVTIVLNGDVPLIKYSTLNTLFWSCFGFRLTLLTVNLEDPTGYGRVLREEGKIKAIVEHKDATDEQRQLKEVYTGVLAAPTKLLRGWLPRLKNDNAQREYYLTDVVKLAIADGIEVNATQPASLAEVLGVNSPDQLAELERLCKI